VQRQSLSGLFKHFDCLFLLFRQAGDQTRLDVAPDRPHKVRIVVGQNLAVVEVEDLKRGTDIEISSKAHIATCHQTDRLTAFCTHPF
jgi:hypothetical protein